MRRDLADLAHPSGMPRAWQAAVDSEHETPQVDPVEDAYGMPWTVLVPRGDGYLAADLEHPAPLPRIGDTVEYIDEAGARHWYRVRDVVHTIQSPAAGRPSVREGGGSPNSTPRLGGDAEPPASTGQVRAGLARVYLEEAEPRS